MYDEIVNFLQYEVEPSIFIGWTEDPYVDPRMLTLLAGHPVANVRLRLARHASTPPEVIAELIHDSCPDVADCARARLLGHRAARSARQKGTPRALERRGVDRAGSPKDER